MTYPPAPPTMPWPPAPQPTRPWFARGWVVAALVVGAVAAAGLGTLGVSHWPSVDHCSDAFVDYFHAHEGEILADVKAGQSTSQLGKDFSDFRCVGLNQDDQKAAATKAIGRLWPELLAVGFAGLANGVSSTAPTAAPTTVPDSNAVPYSQPSTATTTTVTEEPTPADAESQLEQIHEGDLAQVDLSTSQWVAQLNSKSVGMAVDGEIITADDILSEHEALVSRFSNGDGEGQVLLLQSTDAAPHDLYHGSPMWVTLALNSWTSKWQVQAWCQQNWPTLHGDALKNVCMPRTLSY